MPLNKEAEANIIPFTVIDYQSKATYLRFKVILTIELTPFQGNV